MKTITNTVNIAVVTQNYAIPAWQYRALENILQVEGIELSLLLNYPTEKIHPFIFQPSQHIERYLYHCQPQFFAHEDIQEIANDAERIDLSSEALVDLSNTDFVINFTENVLADDLLVQPKLGVWSIFIGDNQQEKSQLSAINDFISESDVVTLGLQIETFSITPNITLHQSSINIDMKSPCLTARQCLQKASYFIPHYLKKIQIKESVDLKKVTSLKLSQDEVFSIESVNPICQSINSAGNGSQNCSL
ncbi:MAG TPA: hypothetical protein EYG68_10080 [Leucothrix mucor]|nr:hypothetical protein [Leucothrix mucor]